MTKPFRLSLVVAAASVTVGLIIASCSSDTPTGNGSSSIHWLKYDSALEQAQKENRHVLVSFRTSSCSQCKQMDATTYEDREVIAVVGRDFVAAVVNGDSDDSVKTQDGYISERALTSQYGVSQFPTTLFLEPDGKKITPLKNYIEPTKMEAVLEYIRTNANEKMTLAEFLADHEQGGDPQ